MQNVAQSHNIYVSCGSGEMVSGATGGEFGVNKTSVNTVWWRLEPAVVPQEAPVQSIRRSRYSLRKLGSVSL